MPRSTWTTPAPASRMHSRSPWRSGAEVALGQVWPFDNYQNDNTIMCMTETELNQLIDDVMMQIEDALDELEIDIDFESSGGILTIVMENNSQIIINRQISAMQLWLAAKSGGYHFNYDNKNGWLDERSGEPFLITLNRCLTEQAGAEIELAFD